VLFFHQHSRVLLTRERLAASVGYNLEQVTRSLDMLIQAGLVEQSQHPTHVARLYALTAPESGWLAALLEVASTRDGRRNLIEALPDAASTIESVDTSPKAKDQRSRAARKRIAPS
jgi:hypothetical protein